MMNINKTPVSILQEMMVKKCVVPSYELVQNGSGTHQNIFTYKVVCDGLSATGTGRCKKDAKHEAATKMLEVIAKHNALPQLPASPCESPVRTPLPMSLPVYPKSPANVPFHNAIGDLQTLCSSNNLANPEYKEVNDVGPPHARVFTVHCVLSTFVEEGTATTKKQAKHEAARKMLERISGVVTDDTCNQNDIKRKEQIASEIAIAKYPQLSVKNKEVAKSKINWGLKIKDYPKRFKGIVEDEKTNDFSMKFKELVSDLKLYKSFPTEENFIELKKNFESLIKFIDISFRYDNLTSKNPSTFIVGLRLSTAPDIYEIGLGSTRIEAEANVLQFAIETMDTLDIKIFIGNNGPILWRASLTSKELYSSGSLRSMSSANW